MIPTPKLEQGDSSGARSQTGYASSFRTPARRRRSGGMMGLLAMTAMMAGSFGGLSGGYSSAAERHDPDRTKTPKDLEQMAAAQRKRDRKKAKKPVAILSITSSSGGAGDDKKNHETIPNIPD